MTLVRLDGDSVRRQAAVFGGEVNGDPLAGSAAPREGSVVSDLGTSAPWREGGFTREPDKRHDRVALLEARGGAVDDDAGLAAHRRACTCDRDFCHTLKFIPFKKI